MCNSPIFIEPKQRSSECGHPIWSNLHPTTIIMIPSFSYLHPIFIYCPIFIPSSINVGCSSYVCKLVKSLIKINVFLSNLHPSVCLSDLHPNVCLSDLHPVCLSDLHPNVCLSDLHPVCACSIFIQCVLVLSSSSVCLSDLHPSVCLSDLYPVCACPIFI